MGAAKAALDAVDLVTWGITSSGTGPQPGNPPYNLTESEPYTTNATLLHEVIDRVALAIEAVRSRCGGGGADLAVVKTDDCGMAQTAEAPGAI